MMRGLVMTFTTMLLAASVLFAIMVFTVKEVRVPLHVTLDKKYTVMKIDTLDGKIKRIYYLER